MHEALPVHVLKSVGEVRQHLYTNTNAQLSLPETPTRALYLRTGWLAPNALKEHPIMELA